MTTKEKVLNLFQANQGTFLSGEEMAQALCVTRAAVWKAVKALREEGYPIDAATKKGYCLSSRADLLTKEGIECHLKGRAKELRLMVESTLSSTNTVLRDRANEGEQEGLVLLAGEQTGGRGRLGRKFYSPQGTGLYLSLLLRPKDWSPRHSVRLTTMAAAAACEAIRELTKLDARIKWVNDIYLSGKKVCGILTEAAFGLETGCLDYAVLGVGINVYPPANGFPEELKETAGAVFCQPGEQKKNRLAAAFLNRFMEYYAGEDSKAYIEAYRRYSLVIGKAITVLNAEGERSAQVLGIDDDCHLLVRYENGEEAELSYGEIRIRPNR